MRYYNLEPFHTASGNILSVECKQDFLRKVLGFSCAEHFISEQ